MYSMKCACILGPYALLCDIIYMIISILSAYMMRHHVFERVGMYDVRYEYILGPYTLSCHMVYMIISIFGLNVATSRVPTCENVLYDM